MKNHKERIREYVTREGLPEEAITLFEECIGFETFFMPDIEFSEGKLETGRITFPPGERPSGRSVKIENMFCDFKKFQSMIVNLGLDIVAAFSMPEHLAFLPLCKAYMDIMDSMSLDLSEDEATVVHVLSHKVGYRRLISEDELYSLVHGFLEEKGLGSINRESFSSINNSLHSKDVAEISSGMISLKERFIE